MEQHVTPLGITPFGMSYWTDESFEKIEISLSSYHLKGFDPETK